LCIKNLTKIQIVVWNVNYSKNSKRRHFVFLLHLWTLNVLRCFRFVFVVFLFLKKLISFFWMIFANFFQFFYWLFLFIFLLNIFFYFYFYFCFVIIFYRFLYNFQLHKIFCKCKNFDVNAVTRRKNLVTFLSHCYFKYAFGRRNSSSGRLTVVTLTKTLLPNHIWHTFLSNSMRNCATHTNYTAKLYAPCFFFYKFYDFFLTFFKFYIFVLK